jgi:hypothetical protein
MPFGMPNSAANLSAAQIVHEIELFSDLDQLSLVAEMVLCAMGKNDVSNESTLFINT